MKRRNFFLTVITGLLAVVATKSTSRPNNNYVPAADSAHWISGLAEIFDDVETAVDVGEVYLRTYSGNNTLTQLLSGVSIDPQSQSALCAADFHSRRQRDFLEGNTLLLDGWVMARCELCACALLAYSRKDRGIR